MTTKEYIKMTAAAAGKKKSDLVLKNGQVINVFTNKIEICDIAICNGIIVGIGSYEGINEIDLDGKYVSPGFFDAHIHMESALVTPRELVKNVLKWGTTSFIEDPHEAANVKGSEGIDYILSQTENIPANVFVMLPSCVPSLKFENNGGKFNPKDMKKYLNNPRVLGLGEVMDYPSVINSDVSMMKKIDMFKNLIIDGHAPNLCDLDLNAYLISGIATDHEATTYEYALKEVSRGIHVHIREGSAAKNLDDIVRGIVENKISTENFSFCTDDKHIEEIKNEGHISYSIKRAISLGIDPISAIKMATINTARCYGIKNLGAIAPGYQADLVMFDNFADFEISDVYHKGKNIKSFKWASINLDSKHPLKNTIDFSNLSKNSFSMPLDVSKEPVINLIDNQILTSRSDEYLPNKNGFFIADSNFNKIAIVERHKNTGLVGKGVVKGFGISGGAIASSVSHDSHNISVIGDNNSDMLIAVLELQKKMGGITIVSDGRVIKTLALPVMGLMSEEPFEEVNQKIKEMISIAHSMGVSKNIDPFITLSFISLPVIPEIRITPKGTFDVLEMKFI
ncbi:adenine deaminase [Proteocatella sphenisci]|uniref:adenine deaminase n=1 Tax=Proteocatella sphenisci TaxID=181070 RepID=UPI00048F1E43|nr:adenine deaminase [Proteocatella sphenisci]